MVQTTPRRKEYIRDNVREVGSIFELVDPPAMATNFRSALHAIIEAKKPERIVLPNYYCPSMSAGWRYDVKLDSGKTCCSPIDHFLPGDLVVVVNYFGFKNESFWDMPIPKDVTVVEDMSMSFYLGPHPRSDFWIYNLRKFFCLPDGALIYSRKREGLVLDKASSWWKANLTATMFRTVGLDRQEWYGVSRDAKKSVPCGPYKMSDYSISRLGLIHDLTAAEKRRINYRCLADAGIDPILYPFQDEVPWGFPTLHRNATEVCKAMAKADVFAPVVWDDPVLMLPCDQRYTPEDMKRVAKVFKENA